MHILNIAGYKFIHLDALSELQAYLLAAAEEAGCRGTILLSDEGVNISLAGEASQISQFQEALFQDTRFADMTFRQSYSSYVPFKQMKVKIKPEIITMHTPEVNPIDSPAPSISPVEFKQWLDENRDITVLDTRNDYEVRFGTFKNAAHFQLHDFGEFPLVSDAVDRDKPVVMFCTGGIRCEKAAVHMIQQGYTQVYQLEGGILNYFAAVGGDHYEGECFVFDQRVALNAKLEETGTVQCMTCQGPVLKAQACSQCIN